MSCFTQPCTSKTAKIDEARAGVARYGYGDNCGSGGRTYNTPVSVLLGCAVLSTHKSTPPAIARPASIISRCPLATRVRRRILSLLLLPLVAHHKRHASLATDPIHSTGNSSQPVGYLGDTYTACLSAYLPNSSSRHGRIADGPLAVSNATAAEHSAAAGGWDDPDAAVGLAAGRERLRAAAVRAGRVEDERTVLSVLLH